jgi:putative tryptophan/tyrosine transport system substrate-binding protein
MNKTFVNRHMDSPSDNRKFVLSYAERAKIKNPKFALVLGALLFALCSSADAQQAGKVHRIGVLSAVDVASFSDNADALRQALRDLGYVEGQNLTIEYRYAEGKIDRLPELAAKLVRRKVDVIVVSSSPAVSASRDTAKEIPIVFSVTGDPVATGLVASLARPAGNVTGITMGSSDLYGKRLELLKETIPRLSRVALLFNPEIPTARVGLKETQLAAKALAIRIESLEVRNAKDIDRAFESATKLKVGGITFIQNPPITSNRKQVVELAVKNRIPAIFADTEWCNDAGLMCYGRYIPDTYRRLAVYVDKILKGTKPADLPVEQWTKLQLVFNLNAAKQIGIAIPPNLLARADRVIR